MFNIFKKADPFVVPCEVIAQQAHIRVMPGFGIGPWFKITADTKQLKEMAITNDARLAFINKIEARIVNRQVDDPESALKGELYITTAMGFTTHMDRRVEPMDGNGGFVMCWHKDSKRAAPFISQML